MNFYKVLSEAIRDIEANGFDSVARVELWLIKIRDAAVQALIPEHVLIKNLNKTMRSIYQKMIDAEGYIKIHPGVSRFTIQNLKPKLHAELERRVMASAGLIKLNRERMIQETMQRFSGWATSVPAGGSRAVEMSGVKDGLKKSFQELPFNERRVIIDQGHKFTSELNNIIAVDGGAIAAKWHSHWRQANYNYRKDHKERDELVYAIRGNWALEKGLMKAGPNGYTDQITKPGEEPFCRCNYQYLYNLRDLPADMLTAKGSEALWKVRAINA